jgi:hypothetical protein
MEYVRTTQTRPLFRGTQIVWYLLDLLEALLLFRFILKLLGANPAAAFTQIIYALTAPFVLPFAAVFRTSHVIGATFEWTTLLAMLVYWLIAWAIVRLLVMGKPVTTAEADYRLRQQDVDEEVIVADDRL